MPIFVLFVSAGVLFQGVFPLWVLKRKWLQSNFEFGFSCKQKIYLMNHVQFPAPHYHYHYSICVCLICAEISSFHTDFYILVCNLAKNSFFFSIRMYNATFCLLIVHIALHVSIANKKSHTPLKLFSSLSPLQYDDTFHLHTKQKFAHTLLCSTILICKLEIN